MGCLKSEPNGLELEGGIYDQLQSSTEVFIYPDESEKSNMFYFNSGTNKIVMDGGTNIARNGINVETEFYGRFSVGKIDPDDYWIP